MSSNSLVYLRGTPKGSMLTDLPPQPGLRQRSPTSSSWWVRLEEYTNNCYINIATELQVSQRDVLMKACTPTIT